MGIKKYVYLFNGFIYSAFVVFFFKLRKRSANRTNQSSKWYPIGSLFFGIAIRK